jgi:hypothetical protein
VRNPAIDPEPGDHVRPTSIEFPNALSRLVVARSGDTITYTLPSVKSKPTMTLLLSWREWCEKVGARPAK